MILMWGQKLYGKVDQTPGGFYVATNFYYLNFIPLVPTATYLVTASQGGQFEGVKLRMSLKSVLFTWLRAGLVVAFFFALVVAVAAGVEANRNPADLPVAITAGVVTAFCAAFFWLSYRLSRATPGRCAAIARANGLPVELFAGQFDEPIPAADPHDEPLDAEPATGVTAHANDDLERRARGE